jgi:hypothetical protein
MNDIHLQDFAQLMVYSICHREFNALRRLNARDLKLEEEFDRLNPTQNS